MVGGRTGPRPATGSIASPGHDPLLHSGAERSAITHHRIGQPRCPGAGIHCLAMVTSSSSCRSPDSKSRISFQRHAFQTAPDSRGHAHGPPMLAAPNSVHATRPRRRFPSATPPAHAGGCRARCRSPRAGRARQLDVTLAGRRQIGGGRGALRCASWKSEFRPGLNTNDVPRRRCWPARSSARTGM